MAKITEDLKKHFENSPGKTRVWVDGAGEWSNFPHKNYPTEVSRKEALGKEVEKVIAPDKEATATAGAGPAAPKAAEVKPAAPKTAVKSSAGITPANTNDLL